MDQNKLSMEVSSACGFQVHCKWRVIPVANFRSLSPEEKTRAIHFEVDAVHEARAKKSLSRLCAHTNKDSSEFPAGYRLRFVLSMSHIPQSSRPMFTALVNRQHTFLNMVANKEIHYAGSSIDYKHANLPKTIR